MLSLLILIALAAEPNQLEPRRFAADGTLWRMTTPLTDGQMAEARQKHRPLTTWLERVKKERSLELRVDAVNTLAEITRNPHALESERELCSQSALRLLSDKEPAIRLKALRVIEAHGDESQCRPKLAACLKDRERAIREAAVKLLAKYGDDSSVKPVAALAAADAVLWGDCVATLVAIGTPDSAQAIERMLKKTKEPQQRERLLAAIDQINRKRE